MAPRTCSTKHIVYVHIVLTWRNWWLYLHSCSCDVTVAMCPCVCVCCPLVGAVSVVESPDSCRVGAGSIPTTYMAPPPKRRRKEEETQLLRAANGAGRGAHCCRGWWCKVFAKH